MAAVVDAVRNTIAENFGGVAHSLAKKEHQFSLEEVPDQSGKVAVITGGSKGYLKFHMSSVKSLLIVHLELVLLAHTRCSPITFPKSSLFHNPNQVSTKH